MKDWNDSDVFSENERIKETGRKTTGIFVAYFLIYIVWGSTYYYVGVALEGFPPFLLGAFRFTAAGMILLGWCCLRGESVFKNKLIGKSAVSGIVLLFIDMAVVMSAQQYLSSSLVAVIASSTAIWIMSLDMPMWKKNFRSPATVTGIIIGFLGVIMLYVEQLNAENKANVHTEYGVLILVFGSVSWALGTLYAKYRSSGEENVNAFAGSAWQMLFAGAMFWICSSVNGDVNNTDFAEIPDSSWFSLAYLIVFGSILTYSAYIWLLKIRPAAEVGTHAYVNPLVAVCIGTTLGKETVTFVQLAGLAVILLSVMLINKRIK